MFPLLSNVFNEIADYLAYMFSKFAELSPSAIAVVAALAITGIGGIFFLRKSKDVRFSTKMLVYASMSIALAFVLSYIRLYKMPQGGSVTPGSMLPILLFAYIFGPIPGILTGIAYGFLQFIQDSYLVHWAQLLFDYPIAFGMLGLAGINRKNFVLSSSIAIFGRFVMHFLSGIIFFADSAGDQHVVLYSLGYNGTYLVAEYVICIVIAMLPPMKDLVNRLQRTADLEMNR
ncbi:MAG: energy-coupled thiamine transporter ThiT [Clostridia bacterium]|nr:energy-coupled thiamine transporter ThiT [Clostridia bacterium]MDD4681289.1 energy-coupled thiamine transporter ThiT [Clostridia bacterium]